jgi:hypothetical protein
MTILTKEQWEASVTEMWSASIKATHQHLIDEAVKAEREACAEICKKHADFYAGLEPSPIAQSAWAACVDNRDTIRARGQA